MKKSFFLVYGILCYVIFFVTFLYTVGFISSWVVPKHIDSAPQSSLGFALLVNASLLGIFALQHSIMARPAFKKWWANFVPAIIERSTYVIVSSLCLVLLFWQWQPIGGIIWEIKNPTTQLLLKLLSMVGFGIVLVSTFLINHFDLFGLRQVWLYFTGKEYFQISFKMPFVYKYVRHPLYFGFVVAFWAAPTMTAAHLFFALIMTVYIIIAIQFEEKDLIQYFGATYLQYRKSAPMLIPFTKFTNTKNPKGVKPMSIISDRKSKDETGS